MPGRGGHELDQCGQAQQEAAEHEAEAAKISFVAAAAGREAESKKLQGEGTANQRKVTCARHAESVQLLRECGVSGKGSERNPVGHPVF